MEWENEVINNINEGVMVIDTNFKITFANNAVSSIGLISEEIIGKNILEIFPNLTEQKSTFIKVIKSGEALINNLESFVTYRGERKTTLTSTFPLIKNGSIVGAYEVFQDFSAFQYLNEQVLKLQIKDITTKDRLEHSPKDYEETFPNFIGEDEVIKKLKKQIDLFANSPSNILIYGETGTGKEVVVQNIHRASKKDIPLITQNCAAIPDNLLEAYLFGTVKGAYTGAIDKKGLFEIANGGILFLDEINSLSKSLQAKLLRVIQEQKVRRVGGTDEINVNVRIIAATNVHPKELMENKEFREDLYFRLCVLNIELPPLRNRKTDIPILVHHFINYYNNIFNKKIMGISDEAIAMLIDYSWPGNIRELKNIIERVMNVVQSDYIVKSDIQITDFLQVFSKPNEIKALSKERNIKLSFKDEIQSKEIEVIKQALQQTNGNVSKAARILDLPQQTLNNKVKKYNLETYIHKIKLLIFE